jgi:hypothetical protein
MLNLVRPLNHVPDIKKRHTVDGAKKTLLFCKISLEIALWICKNELDSIERIL